jgi:hypothetical protein
MKIRTILMASAFVAPTGFLVAFKANHPMTTPIAIISNGQCIQSGLSTDQPFCDASLTGPQCTALSGTKLAYEFEPSTTPSCSIPLRQPF